MQDFTKLKVWQKAHRLAIDLKRRIDRGPKWNYLAGACGLTPNGVMSAS